jgi:hypothetical protein
MTRPTETRSTTGTVELRAADTGLGRLGGYALKWRTLSQNLGGFVETIELDAVDDQTVRGERGDVVARYQHDDQYLLGRLVSSTLRLSKDAVGVEYDVDLPETSYARDVRALAERGDLRYSSFAFRVLDEDWDYTDQGFPLRVLRSIQLVDVAPVVNPAYMDTTTGLRHLAEKRGLDVDTVLKAASVDELDVLLRAGAPTVIDTKTSGSSGQGATHPPLSVRRLRMELARKAL